MLVYYICENYRREMYKREYQEEDSVLCLDIDPNIIDDAITYAICNDKVFVDTRIGLSVCSVKDVFKQKYGCSLAKKRLINMRMQVVSVSSNNNSTTISLRPDLWMSQEISCITLYRDKETHKLWIGDISYRSDSEAKSYKKLLYCSEYKNAMMDVAIEKSLKEDE